MYLFELGYFPIYIRDKPTKGTKKTPFHSFMVHPLSFFRTSRSRSHAGVIFWPSTLSQPSGVWLPSHCGAGLLLRSPITTELPNSPSVGSSSASSSKRSVLGSTGPPAPPTALPPLWSPYGHFCCCSAVQSCPTLCDPMDCSMPGFPVHHQLPKLAQIHVHRVGNTIQLS